MLMLASDKNLLDKELGVQVLTKFKRKEKGGEGEEASWKFKHM